MKSRAAVVFSLICTIAMIDSFSLYVALAPLSVYFILIGMINMSRRPFLVTTQRDLGALLTALVGLAAVGPMELLFPLNAAWNYGPFVWCFLLAIYGLAAFLISQLQRPGMNVYNISLADLRMAVSDIALETDASSRWAGDSLAIPSLGVQLYLEENAPLRNASLLANGAKQSAEGWRFLKQKLSERFSQTPPLAPKNTCGIVFLLVGVLSFVFLHALIWWDSVEFLKAIPDFLRI